jgi:uncharacterized protein (UPF0548 family)
MTEDDPWTYDEVGATRELTLPAGYHHLLYRAPVGRGPAGFRAAADAVLDWRMQRGAGVTITAAAPRAAPGLRVTSRLGVGPARLSAPCRVVWVDDDDGARRAGYAYGTLPGHPETGEESFLVTLDEDGTVWLTIRAFSRPATRLTRWAGPLGRLFQRYYARRCAAALRRLASPG